MSLDLNKLEKVRKLENGIVQARCPACAESGNDRKGEHLRILADGRFGCCVHPKSGAHRKGIFALAGDRTPGTFSVRVKVATRVMVPQSVKAALTAFTDGTVGTAKTNSVQIVQFTPALPLENLGTLGTPFLNPYAYEKNISHMYKDSESAVPSVLVEITPEPQSHVGKKLPYLTADGTLVIPFDSPERYHWWKPDGERLTVADTLSEVKERMKHALAI